MTLAVLSNSWALLLGMLLLILGNGLHCTLLGLCGEIEQFSTFEMSIVMSAYFVEFLGASRFCARSYSTGWTCLCLCGTGFFNFCGLDHLSTCGASACVDVWEIINWNLFLRCIYLRASSIMMCQMTIGVRRSHFT